MRLFVRNVYRNTQKKSKLLFWPFLRKVKKKNMTVFWFKIQKPWIVKLMHQKTFISIFGDFNLLTAQILKINNRITFDNNI